MTTRGGQLQDDQQNYYICGRCRTQQFYLSSDEPNPVCDVCGYEGLGNRYEDVPTEVKLDINQY